MHSERETRSSYRRWAEVQLRPARRRLGDEVHVAAKRMLDIVFSLVLLAVASPALLIITLAIKLDSRGPAIFIQKRAGSVRITKGGRVWWQPREFDCYKFRSMYSDADDSAHRGYIKSFVNGHLEAAAEPSFKMTTDARVTTVGRFIRRTSLDELPQLVNVLKGDMSLVGPRPVPLYEVAEYEPWHYERLAARPGITGIWQIYGRGRVTFDEMMRMDIDYVRRPSLRSDVKLLLLTVPAVVAGRGAY